MTGNVVNLDRARHVRDAGTSSGGSDPWLTKRQIASVLGFSVRWVEYRLAEGMPHRRIGGLVRMQRSAVEAWLDGRERGKLTA